MGASGYRPETQEMLVKNVRAADRVVGKAKEDYGNGVSTKGIVVNVAGEHHLRLVRKQVQTGREWSDAAQVSPPGSVGHLEAAGFFHTKKDVEMRGDSAGFTYRVLDPFDGIKGVVSVAWYNPWSAAGSSGFVYYIRVSQEDELDYCLHQVSKTTESTISGDVTVQDQGRLKEFITVNVR
eukprot:TRINITY_DN2011_c0_g1_i1.p1 TRINITY_DN2011_c0_g1~~TRINITY_DN2011_c0_g1_i1.p1  ORF type:complete len:201 (-),score=27.50 TRINITY_DN2011_c0_g1_i1:308-847(-)